MSFKDIINSFDWDDIKQRIYSKTIVDVVTAINTAKPGIEDFMALVSPAADAYIESMAALSRMYTQQRFGKTIQFYVPVYLSNSCVNHCVYCGFNHNNDINRIILNDIQIASEINAVKRMGNFEHVLLVTGEDPQKVGVDYIRRAIRIAKKNFASISLEVQPLRTKEYEELIEEGLNTVYCYQETYNKAKYKLYHPKGMKSKFDWRLDTFDRLGQAGVRKMGLGILIGLEDWRTEAVFMALHLNYLRKKYWKTKYSVSFPRMRPHEGELFSPNVVMSERELAQLIFAFRIFDHDLEISLSTRESSVFRDNMATLGVTSLSAGSKTDPGGYEVFLNELEQFSVNDDRSPEEIMEQIRKQGYEVVWKDWDMSLQS